MTVPRDTRHEHKAQFRTSGPSIYEWMSITGMGIIPPETINHEDGPIPEPDGGHRRLLPWGSDPFGEISTGDREYSIASAVPSTLRVSHRLSGFLPPEPCGFVSCHIRP
jgi:hypothetical protein